ncbi:MAG TPA: hypothetical protein VM871_09080 [Flavisolibacter sp.]|nr:hypothetical protein [Flavisolibacter sp.]
MEKNTDPKRNRPADEGRQNDPHIRDESAVQPGVSTLSTSKNDEENQHLTRTASDDFREDKEGDEKADKRFDE